MTSTTSINDMAGIDHDANYHQLREYVAGSLTSGDGPPELLFTTDAEGLWDAYLSAIPLEVRQIYNCNACRQFIDRFGGLVIIRDGLTLSPFWDEVSAPEFFRPAVSAMQRIVRRAKVTGRFLSSLHTLGTPKTGEWRHTSVEQPKASVHSDRLQTAGQKMAEIREDYRTLCRALAEFSQAHIDQAVGLLQVDALYRSEKVLGVAEWLQGLQRQRSEAKGAARDNLTWFAVATAPAGFCHPRSSMIGTLLEDIEQGLSLEAVKSRFAAKMHPLQYQRPQAAPSAGNIKQAEDIVAKLGIANSLKRRFARLDEVEAIWKPAPPAEVVNQGGVFGHLQPKGETPVASYMPADTMTWEKFRRKVLPDATAIECYIRPVDNFTALVTAVDSEAPPILQWDLPERRNPVSWYVYHGGSQAHRWGLSSGTWVNVNAVALQPNMWGPDESAFEHQGQGAVFILDGAKERQSDLAIFPEILKSELRQVRSTIEAFSRAGRLEGADEASACGVRIQAGSKSQVRLRVTTKAGLRAEYTIDRWD